MGPWALSESDAWCWYNRRGLLLCSERGFDEEKGHELTVMTLLSMSTPCSAQLERLPCEGFGMPSHAMASFTMLRSDGGVCTPCLTYEATGRRGVGGVGTARGRRARDTGRRRPCSGAGGLVVGDGDADAAVASASS